jgi:protein associated with RNAse G/E
MSTPEVTITYIRPGKEVSYYTEDLVAETDAFIKTFKRFPADIADKLTEGLQKNGFIHSTQRSACITKLYFFHEHFDLLIFQDEHENPLGYYSDIGTPLTRTTDGFEMTDWFLDIWLSPDGTLFELDIDEFEEALSQQLISESDAEIARATFKRLLQEVKDGIYPTDYLK